MAEHFLANYVGDPKRLDRVLRDNYPNASRQTIQELIAGKQVQVNGRTVWLASWKIANGDRITVALPPASLPVPHTTFDPAWILADRGDIIAVNKPSGLLSRLAAAAGRHCFGSRDALPPAGSRHIGCAAHDERRQRQPAPGMRVPHTHGE